VNKKKQKNFDPLKHLTPIVAKPAGKQKFFASFFQKRSPCLACAQLAGGRVHRSVDARRAHPERRSWTSVQ
jgi:hypothetical protein